MAKPNNVVPLHPWIKERAEQIRKEAYEKALKQILERAEKLDW